MTIRFTRMFRIVKPMILQPISYCSSASGTKSVKEKRWRHATKIDNSLKISSLF